MMKPDICAYYRKLLPRMGHQVVGVAQNGLDWMSIYRQISADLVITDIKMPGLDGIDAGGEMNRCHPIPVTLISAHYDAELIARAESGLKHCLRRSGKNIK